MARKKKFDWKPVWEAVKEPAREALLAVLPFFLAYFEALDVWWAVALYAVLRYADKYLHESKKLKKGLTRF
jgi:hypothetical protein